MNQINKYFYLIILISTVAFSQFEYGIKGGVNITASGQIKDAIIDLSSKDKIKENLTGYFFGGYSSLKLLFFYIRPEFQFSIQNRNFNSLKLNQSKLELPVSLGFKLLPILSAFGGPNFQFNFKPKIDEIELSEIQEKTDLGLHLGIRFHFGPLNADIRYDRGLNANELSLLDKGNIPISGTIDLQSNIWSVGLSYKL
tara:strand:- start:2383 stop:2976 length:594 start_codon:yes stop_codon:yes gene_type:complete